MVRPPLISKRLDEKERRTLSHTYFLYWRVEEGKRFSRKNSKKSSSVYVSVKLLIRKNNI